MYTSHALVIYYLKFLTLDHLILKNLQNLFNTDTCVYLITLGYVDIVSLNISLSELKALFHCHCQIYFGSCLSRNCENSSYFLNSFAF